MDTILQELEKEIFDPTGQGIEVVDASFARKLILRVDTLEKQLKATVEEAGNNLEEERSKREMAEEDAMFGRAMSEALGKECETLRSIFPEILEALDHGAPCGPRASIAFLQSTPSLVRDKLKQCCKNSEPQAGGISPDIDDLPILEEIWSEVEDFVEHPDCTIIDAIKLLKCQLAEAKAKNTREAIYKKWK